MVDVAFANILKMLRKQRDLSQETFGFQTGLHRTYISQLERGLKSPSLKTLQKVSQALGITLSELMTLVEKELDNVSTE